MSLFSNLPNRVEGRYDMPRQHGVGTGLLIALAVSIPLWIIAVILLKKAGF